MRYFTLTHTSVTYRLKLLYLPVRDHSYSSVGEVEMHMKSILTQLKYCLGPPLQTLLAAVVMMWSSCLAPLTEACQ